MPYAAEQEYRRDVQQPAHVRHPVASHGDIHVLGKPRGQGDMPPSPKFLDGVDVVGEVEVLHQVEA